VIELGVEHWAVFASDAEPDVSFLPALFRRRCSRLTRMMLHVAHSACSAEQLGILPVVFASRYGEAGATLALLRTLARRQPLTAAGFTHSVHNAQAGLFSIAANNRVGASAIAAGGDTFGAAFLEVVAAMHRGRHGGGLLVVADEVLPDLFARFQIEPPVPYAVAVRLGQDGPRLGFEPGVGKVPRVSALPHALQFVRWLETDDLAITLGTRTPYTWTRLTSTTGGMRG
jgi:Beta-ketoacyl synthase, N-terminal domain